MKKILIMLFVLSCVKAHSQKLRISIHADESFCKTASAEIVFAVISIDSLYLFHELLYVVQQNESIDTTISVTNDQIEESKIYSKTLGSMFVLKANCYDENSFDCYFSITIWIDDRIVYEGKRNSWIEMQSILN